MSIKFGTDGWRAVISDEFTFGNVRKVAAAIGAYLNETSAGATAPIVVGFDTRFLSDRYALEVAQVLAEEGLTVYLSQRDCPTPALAYAIWHWKALGGVMLTASHNPPRYNGIKFKGPHAGPGLPGETRRIEEMLEQVLANDRARKLAERPPVNPKAAHPGIVRFDPMPAYLEHVRKLIDFKAIANSGLRVAVDPMYGAGRGYVAALLREAGCQVTQIHGEMNPGFGGIHPEPIERNLGDLMASMRCGQHDLGLASDGDADRIGAVDANGDFVDPHRILSLILRHLVEERHQTGSVIKTVSTTQLLNKLAQHYALPLHETPVGFNHICDWMLKEDVLIGGEESGGITVKGHVPDGDGILTGLLLTEVVAYQRKPLREIIIELMHEFGEFYYGRHDLYTKAFDKRELTQRLLNEAPDRIMHHGVVAINNSDGVKYVLDDDGWLLIRPSGTEPVLRIYAEARSVQEVPQLLAAGAGLAHVQADVSAG